ncbi:MAG: ABC transporter ATP-binding protein [Chloroflexi bacterium]|nr:ABC transporter ATP-binding protein [Chloroflexota bacterium]
MPIASAAPGQTSPSVRISGLSKAYRARRGEVPALANVSLEIADGEILVLLGPSGCGKTTLLRCVAGLERPDAGEIKIGGSVVFSSVRGISVPPERRNLGMVFQSYALWPHMTVFDNIAYPLRNLKMAAAEVGERTRAVLGVVGLDALARAYPGQLSGGQQQRVALARAIVSNEGVILFDEPLSNLDAKVRERIRLELLALHKDIRFSALYVTHDQTEAAALGDRIAVMNAGEVAQVGTPAEVYHRPETRYVADFVGSTNELAGTIIEFPDNEGSCRVETAVGRIHGRMTPVADAHPGDAVTVIFRPEHCRIGEAGVGDARANRFVGHVERSIFLGSYVEYLVRAGGAQLVLRSMDGDLLPEGTELSVYLAPERARVFPRV